MRSMLLPSALAVPVLRLTASGLPPSLQWGSGAGEDFGHLKGPTSPGRAAAQPIHATAAPRPGSHVFGRSPDQGSCRRAMDFGLAGRRQAGSASRSRRFPSGRWRQPSVEQVQRAFDAFPEQVSGVNAPDSNLHLAFAHTVPRSESWRRHGIHVRGFIQS